MIFKTYFDNQYRRSVVLFNNNDIRFGLKFTKPIGRKRWRYSNTYISKYIFGCFHLLVITVVSLFDYLRFKFNLFLLCGDVELNPGPKQNIVKKNICYWIAQLHIILRSWSFLRYNSIGKFDIIYLLETYSNLWSDDSNLETSGYNVVCFDHASNNNVEGFVYTTRVIAFKNHRYQLLKRVCQVWTNGGW